MHIFFLLKPKKNTMFAFVFVLGMAWQNGAGMAWAQEQTHAQTIDLETAIQYYTLNQWMPALASFQALAEAGDPVAQGYLGSMYRDGLGVARDVESAERWLRVGAQNGNPHAHHQLGWMYARAEITENRDFKSAVKHWKAAAEGGNANAQLDLGVMYWRGEGAPKDMIMAYTWLKLAEQDKDLSGMIETNLVGLRKQMSPEQIEAAEKLARDLKVEMDQRS